MQRKLLPRSHQHKEALHMCYKHGILQTLMFEASGIFSKLLNFRNFLEKNIYLKISVSMAQLWRVSLLPGETGGVGGSRAGTKKLLILHIYCNPRNFW